MRKHIDWLRSYWRQPGKGAFNAAKGLWWRRLVVPGLLALAVLAYYVVVVKALDVGTLVALGVIVAAIVVVFLWHLLIVGPAQIAERHADEITEKEQEVAALRKSHADELARRDRDYGRTDNLLIILARGNELVRDDRMLQENVAAYDQWITDIVDYAKQNRVHRHRTREVDQQHRREFGLNSTEAVRETVLDVQSFVLRSAAGSWWDTEEG